jgi:hypothetical protein
MINSGTIFRSLAVLCLLIDFGATHAQASAFELLSLDFNMAVKEYTTPAVNGHCPDGYQLVKKSATLSSTNFMTDQMVKAAYPFFNRPYENAPGELTSSNGITVYRPNHGITHAVRSGALSADLMEFILKNPSGGEFQSWLKAKIAADPTYPQKVEMIGLMHRSGRTDEADSKNGPPEKRQKEMQACADNFKAAAANSGLKFTPSELDDFANSIILDGEGSSNADQDHLSRLLRSAHNVELIRVGMKFAGDIQGAIPEVTDNEVTQLYKREATYLSTTGDQRQAGEGYTPAFYKLSTDPSALLQAMIDVRKANSLP